MRSKRRALRQQFIEIVEDATLSVEERVDRILDVAFPEKSLTLQQAMVGALGQVMLLEPSLNGGRLAKLAADLLKAGSSPEEIVALYTGGNCPWREDWRGKKGGAPGEADIRATLRQLREVARHAKDAMVVEI